MDNIANPPTVIVCDQEYINSILKVLIQRIDALTSEVKNGSSGRTTEWASQATLADRYDMSRPNMWRYIATGVSEGKIEVMRPQRGDTKGVNRYRVSDVDAYMRGEGTITRKEWK